MKGLKIILWISGIGSLFAFINVIIPWHFITDWMNIIGIEPPGNEGATMYMYRLGFLAYGMLGIFLVMLARNPLKYGGMLILAAIYLISYGMVRLAGGILYEFPVWHYLGDVIFGNIFGILILILRKKEMKKVSAVKA